MATESEHRFPMLASWAGRSTSSPSCTTAADWQARLFIFAVFIGLACLTWAHWGDLRADIGREMYVPAMIAQGKMLYRDVWYPFGPLAPYIQALIFRIFGAQLVVLYLSGLAITLCYTLVLYELSRRLMPPVGAALVSLGLLMQAFLPSLFNYVLPYAFAATYGSLLGVVFLYFLIRYIRREPGPNLLLSGLAAGLALLAKQEFGVACWLVLSIALIGDYWNHRSLRRLARQVLWCIPGLAIFFFSFGWFVWRLSLRFILFDNFQSTPGAYFMRTFGAKWVADRGLRFIPSEILSTMGSAFLILGVWFCAAWVIRIAVQWFSARTVFRVVAAGSVMALIGFITHRHWGGYLFWHRSNAISLFFPIGMFWVACVAFLWNAIQFLRTGNREYFAPAVVSVYALVSGIRIMVQVEPRNYSIYYDPVIFLTFVFFLVTILQWVLRPLPEVAGPTILFGLLTIEAAGLIATLLPLPFPDYELASGLHTDYGLIYTTSDREEVLRQVIAFMKEQKALGKKVVVLPEEVPLYFFTGTQAPSRWYELSPGLLLPEDEDAYIAALKAADIDYVLLSNRSYFEYGIPYFGLDFHQKIYRWIQDNYEVTGEFGHFVRKLNSPYALQTYQKRVHGDQVH
jgi:Dolichyl-phosphate-mannose-protein mannosyltransferase